MHARVATFEGTDLEAVQRGLEEIKRRGASGPPVGVPAVGLLVLHKPDDGRVLSITLFETEEELREGDATLSAMDSPAPGGVGRRVSVEVYEVGAKIDA